MRTLRLTLIVLGAAVLVSPIGCASIVSGRHAEVAFDSYPSSADVVIHDRDGREVANLRTPGVVSLRRNRRYFMPARYTATIAAPGYHPAHVPIRSTVNPWILGNIVFGGIPGLFVDNATGAAWKPKRSEFHRQLAPLDAGPLHTSSEIGGRPIEQATADSTRSR